MNERSGISLVEIMVSMGILSLILIPVFFTFSSGNRNMMISENEFRAHTAALEIIEQLISLPFKHIPVGIFNSDAITGKTDDDLGIVPFNVSENPDFKPEVKISEIKKNGRLRFKKIEVKIIYPAAKTDKRERKFVLKTLVANEENK
ncbi:MAG: prepilin-type N-terminal cleavage/methylation domain-containing protein [Candidatus Riflebacteria bacterium]